MEGHKRPRKAKNDLARPSMVSQSHGPSRRAMGLLARPWAFLQGHKRSRKAKNDRARPKIDLARPKLISQGQKLISQGQKRSRKRLCQNLVGQVPLRSGAPEYGTEPEVEGELEKAG